METQKILVNLAGLLFECTKPELLADFQWENFEEGKKVWCEELFNNETCVFERNNKIHNIIHLRFEPIMAESVNIFLQNAKCVLIANF